MPESWTIRVYDQSKEVVTTDVSGRFELGRQEGEKERLYSKTWIESRPINLVERRVMKTEFWRVVVADRGEDSVSRDHAFFEPLGPGRALLQNVSNKVVIRLQDGSELAPSETREIALPAGLTLGRKVIRIVEQAAGDEAFRRLPTSVSQAGLSPLLPDSLSTLAFALPRDGEPLKIEQLVPWLKDTMRLFQSAADAGDFFGKAAAAMVETLKLDSGYVVLFQGDLWKTEGAWSAGGQAVDTEPAPSRSVLRELRRTGETVWQIPALGEADGRSLIGVSAVVASPITVNGEIVGALYGDRRKFLSPGQPPHITESDAMIVDMLASCVAVGIARRNADRQASEASQKANEARGLFEQFFTKELASEIEKDRTLLESRDAEISVLFADVRGFSRISEKLGAAKTVEWLNGVMTELSECVLAHDGVLVDYIGDELMAMWGAPKAQADHAALACRAAIDMLKLLPAMNAKFRKEFGTIFQDELKDESTQIMDLGIGINSGSARVGNTGAAQKFKYGPLGDTVNRASRVQGLTKYMKVQLLVTEETHQAVKKAGGFSARRVSGVRVVNIGKSFNVYEVVEPNAAWEGLSTEYESALGSFERQDFEMAYKILGNVMSEHYKDGPARFLLARLVNSVDPTDFDPVFVAPGK